MNRFDWVIIGSGPAGFESALGLAHRGHSVALVEKGDLGGVCLNRGCIPTKVMASAAKRLEKLKSGKRYGISIPKATFSWPDLKKYQQRVISGLRKGLEQRIIEAGITIIRGTASIDGPETVAILDNQNRQDAALTFENLVIATGSSPLVPKDWVGVKGVVDSENFWSLDDLPQDILIVGGGVIGCEYASALSTLGFTVTLVEQEDRLLFTEEPEVSEAIFRSLKGSGVKLFTGTSISSMKNSGGALEITAEGESFSSSLAVCCMGRMRDTAPAGTDLSGAEFLRLNNHTWIAGDIAPGPQLAHKAAHDADIVLDQAAGKDRKPRYGAIPMAVFTSPEVGRAGSTEAEAQERSVVESRTVNLAEMGKAAADSVPQGFLKMVVDSQSRRILGMTILGHEASEFSGYASLVLHNKMTVDDLGQVVFSHPTLGEIFRECSRRFASRSS